MFLPFNVEADAAFEQRRQIPWVTILLGLGLAGLHGWLAQWPQELLEQEVWYRYGATRFAFRWWMPLTCQFLHGGWAHLLFNVYFLWIYGGALERLLGSIPFLVIYLFGGVASIAIQLAAVSPFHIDEPTIGASGAIAAAMGAFFVIQPHAKLECLYFSIISFRPLAVKLPAWLVLGLWFGGQLIYTVGALGAIEGIAFWAHVGGFTVGGGLGTIVYRWMRRQAGQQQQARRAAVADAITAYAQGDLGTAAATAAALGTATGGSHTLAPLLNGMVAADQGGDRTEALAWMLQAFRQARDYRAADHQMTVYLQLARRFAPAEIPPEVHRDAGFQALSMKQRELAESAFEAAISGGLEDGVDMVRRSLGVIRGGPA